MYYDQVSKLALTSFSNSQIAPRRDVELAEDARRNAMRANLNVSTITSSSPQYYHLGICYIWHHFSKNSLRNIVIASNP